MVPFLQHGALMMFLVLEASIRRLKEEVNYVLAHSELEKIWETDVT